MPGENAGGVGGAIVGYLKALESFDARFPGFAHDIHGVEVINGQYQFTVVCEHESSSHS